MDGARLKKGEAKRRTVWREKDVVPLRRRSRYSRVCARTDVEGKWALPHGEFGLDVIALVGSLRYTAQRSIPEIHRDLCDRGVSIAERTVTHLLERYEEFVTLHLADQRRLRERLQEQGQIVLAIDGLQPDVGHEVLWVLRDCLVFSSVAGSQSVKCERSGADQPSARNPTGS